MLIIVQLMYKVVVSSVLVLVAVEEVAVVANEIKEEIDALAVEAVVVVWAALLEMVDQEAKVVAVVVMVPKPLVEEEVVEVITETKHLVEQVVQVDKHKVEQVVEVVDFLKVDKVVKAVQVEQR